MTDVPEPPPSGAPGVPPPPPPPPPPPAGATVGTGMSVGSPQGYYLVPRGVVPNDMSGVYHSIGLTILLTIVTCGIWGIFWTYHTNEELKRYNADGLGGVLGVVIYHLLSVVLMFTIPNEIEKMYQRDGRASPVRAITGLWFLLPIIGNIIWYVKVQDALNDFWRSKGATG
jgi:hypothetical protein